MTLFQSTGKWSAWNARSLPSSRPIWPARWCFFPAPGKPGRPRWRAYWRKPGRMRRFSTGMSWRIGASCSIKAGRRRACRRMAGATGRLSRRVCRPVAEALARFSPRVSLCQRPLLPAPVPLRSIRWRGGSPPPARSDQGRRRSRRRPEGRPARRAGRPRRAAWRRD